MNIEVAPPYRHTPLFPLGKDQTPYCKLPPTACASNASWARTFW